MVKQKGQVQIGLEWHSTCECSKILEMYSTWVSVPNPKLSANSEFEPDFFLNTRDLHFKKTAWYIQDSVPK